MMKRAFEEISDEEWGESTVKLSRVIKRSLNDCRLESDNNKRRNGNVLPSIESFAFRKAGTGSMSASMPSDPISDDEDFQPAKGKTTTNRGKRFIVDDDSEDEVEIIDTGGATASPDSQTESVGKLLLAENITEECGLIGDTSTFEETKSEPEFDVIANALYKCDQIAASLRKELNGGSVSSSALCGDSYAEVENCAVKIVTQQDIDVACEGCSFQPLLKAYQLVGVNFLLLLYRKKIGGAILADEMGLGKTVQAIIFLALLKYLENDPGPHLVVSPASVLENWEREFRKWCPSISVVQFHGARRAALSKELNYLAKSGASPPFNVMLVCYSLFERHSTQQKDDRKVLKKWNWSCILMDEAHVLKDRSSYRRKNLMALAQNAKQRLMITGTPLQNDLQELWSLLEFMIPSIFETGDVYLKKFLSASAEDANIIGRIKSILGPFILRRLKSDVMQQLVQKTHKIECLGMVKEQADAYKEAIEEYREASLSRLGKATSSGVEKVKDFLPNRQISNYFMQLRKISNHPLLVRRIYRNADVDCLAKTLHLKGVYGSQCTLDRVREELLTYNDFSLHQISVLHGVSGTEGRLDDRYALCSAKCQALSRLLPSLRLQGHRALIFSQWTTMLDILEWALDVIGITYSRLDGSTPVADRQTIVDTFNNDHTIFACLLSTRAGGQGLNLTGADTVIIHDMDFNPQMDRQAEDRCHRIGQTKPVTIYRLVTKDTVDENIYEIAKRKLVLDAAILESGAEIISDNGDDNARTMGEILTAILFPTPS